MPDRGASAPVAVSISVVLPDPFGSGDRHPLRSAEVQRDRPSVAEHDVVQDENVAAGRDRGTGQVDGDDVVVADLVLGRPQRLLGLGHVGLVTAAELAGRDLGRALLGSGHDLRHVVGLAAGVALPPVEPHPRLGQLTLLPAQVLLGHRVRDRSAASCSTASAAVKLVRFPPWTRADPARSSTTWSTTSSSSRSWLTTTTGPVQRRTAAVSSAAGPPVEVVRRLVQDQRVRPGEEQTGQRGQHRLAAGQRAHPGVEVEVGQTQLGQRRRDALGQVPVAVEQLEVLGPSHPRPRSGPAPPAGRRPRAARRPAGRPRASAAAAGSRPGRAGRPARRSA